MTGAYTFKRFNPGAGREGELAVWFLAHRIAKPHSYAGYLAAILLKSGTWLGYVKRKVDSTDDLLLFKDKDKANAMAVQLALTGATADAVISHSGPIEVLRLENFQ